MNEIILANCTDQFTCIHLRLRGRLWFICQGATRPNGHQNCSNIACRDRRMDITGSGGMVMKERISELYALLLGQDGKTAYKALQTLQQLSEESADVYSYMDQFADMLDSENSYIRTRGLTLIAYNAKWDTDYKVDEMIDKYLEHITDIKPITARQCIKLLPKIAKAKPELKDDILSALRKADASIFPDSMQSLVYKDIRNSLAEIQS